MSGDFLRLGRYCTYMRKELQDGSIDVTMVIVNCSKCGALVERAQRVSKKKATCFPCKKLRHKLYKRK